MFKLKKASALALAAVALVTLAGCSTVETLQETPNSVIRTSFNGWNGDSTFQYVDSDRQLEDLSNCGKPSFLGKRYCENEDGSVRLEFNTNKANIRNAVLFVDGEEYELNCVTLEDFGRGCIPKGE